MNIEIVNLTDEKIMYDEQIREVLMKALEVEKMDNVLFNVIFVDEDYIMDLNSKYRGIDKVTDVITFALEDEKSMLTPNNMHILGDIYICYQKAIDQSIEYGHSLLRELAFLSVHGFYHLLGYDHMNKVDEEIMFKKQDVVLELCNIERN